VGPGDTVLDICTGTAIVALKIAKTSDARVVGVDLSEGMLRLGQRNVSRAGLGSNVTLLRGRAENLGFSDESFDAVCFTWLLRYVEDPYATIREAVRVLKPGGSLVSLEFGVPKNVIVRNLWNLYTRMALPLATRAISSGWHDLGVFLGPSIADFDQLYSDDDISHIWVDLGISEVQVKRLSMGGGVVMWGTKTGENLTP
jgi:demethylmenaquinone methyltransferase/2-methoxy-6-polyprenyl-1,4-benzoquinol methylase